MDIDGFVIEMELAMGDGSPIKIMFIFQTMPSQDRVFELVKNGFAGTRLPEEIRWALKMLVLQYVPRVGLHTSNFGHIKISPMRLHA